ncbi:hypothetical protein CR513_53664, partial [Mucuna pruriens]
MVEDKVITLRPNEPPNLYIRTTLKGCKKLSHVEGNDPPRDDPKFEAWDDDDSLIIIWLWNSMTLEIIQNFIFYSSENLIETYSMKKDSTACYDIESKIFNSRQGTLSVIEYYGTLNELWIELDQYQRLKMCKADSIAYTRLTERGRIFKFLHGKEKFSSLSESEETRRSVMLHKENSNTGSALMTGKGPIKRSTSKGKSFTKSSHGEYCIYCKGPGHTKDTCYKLYGKEKVLERMGGNKGSTQMWVNQTTSDKENVVEHPSTLQLDQDIQVFSKEEMDRL